jgi:NAD(P)-dependent dehydrogenase (short-subunit alcohol dehydrogenase family)
LTAQSRSTEETAMAESGRGIAVVTGASTGIGRATALDLAANGFEVFAGVRRKADGEALKEAAPENLTPLIIDVTKPATISRAKTAIARKAGSDGVSALVNNAGIAIAGPLEFLPLDDFRRQIEVNLTGHLAVTQALLPQLRKAQGRIVNITSIGGLISYPFNGPYHASKWGLEALSDSLRVELQPWGIDVIAIEPGGVATEIWDRGIDRANELRETMPRDAKKLYGPAMEAMLKLMGGTGDSGLHPDKAAKVIRKALTARRPKTRYLLGRDAKGAIRMKRLLNDRTWDRLVTRIAKVPQRDSALD